MRVLEVSDHYPPAVGGVAVQTRRHAQRLRDRGHEVEVVAASRTPGHDSEEGFPVHRLRVTLDRMPGAYLPDSPPFHPPWPDPDFTAGLTAVVRRFKPDVMHVHGWAVYSAAAVPGRTPIVSTLHDYGMRCPKKTLMRHGSLCSMGRGARCVTCDSETQPTGRRVALASALAAGNGWIARRVFRWIAVSGFVRDRHLQSGWDPDRVVVVPPMIDPPAPVPEGEPPVKGPYVLYVGPGPEGEHKGRHVLLKAFDEIEDGRLVLVGGREPSGLNGDVQDLGYRQGAELSAVLAAASFAVVPSVWPDPCPAVAVEPMALGRPVVASAMGGLTDIVDHDKSGLLVPADDPRALADAMRALLADPARADAMGQVAQEQAQRFSTARVLPQLETIFEEAVHSA
jgi:glycosyltransferase involved in cell wall biosynthesis